MAEEKVAGNKERRHERLLGVSGLHTSKRYVVEEETETEKRVGGGWMEQKSTGEKIKFELTTNRCVEMKEKEVWKLEFQGKTQDEGI